MHQKLLWVDDDACQNQKCRALARQRQARIRSHVQENRSSRAANNKSGRASIEGQAFSSQLSKWSEGVSAFSVRSDKTLRRLVGTSKNDESTCRRKRTTSGKPRGVDNTSLTKYDTALFRALPSLWRGLSSTERSSLAFFELRTSREWSGWEDFHFWNTLALQISQQSQAVARGLIAISTLHERMDATGSTERARLESQSYKQSFKATEELVAKSEIQYLEALVSCLIMICFHGLQHSQTWFRLLRSGLKLLAESNNPACVSLEDRQTADVQIRPLFRRLLARPCSMVEMSKAFTLSVELHRAKAIGLTTEKPLVPCVFRELPEAGQCLRNIFDWAHDNYPPLEDSKLSLYCFSHELHQLCNAWQSSLAGSQVAKTVQSVNSQRLLRAACLVGMIIIDTAHSADECVFDSYLSDFEEVLSLVEGAFLSGHSFGIDAGLFDMVAFVGLKCRDPIIRRKALRLLRSRDRLEGDRIAANPATILEALIALEERDLEVGTCHDVPEQRRRRLACGHQYILQGRIDLFLESSDASQKERCCVSLKCSKIRNRKKKFDGESSTIPDAVFGAGYAAYLENRQTKDYFRIKVERFYFPIPKV